jgi:hypothetical protein
MNDSKMSVAELQRVQGHRTTFITVEL